MKTQEFLSFLCSRDIKLWIENGRLRCSAPKEALTPDIKAELAARQAEILAFIRQANQALKTGSEPIQPGLRPGNIPLSFSQQRLWFLNQLEPNSSAYNIPAAVKITGKLNITALSESIREIIRRHEVLRTTFTVVDGEPIQVIGKAENFTLPVVDLQILPPEQKQQEVLNLAALEAQKPFDLAKGPLIRAKLFRLSETNHVVLLTVHHIISDGWSTGILIKELTALYTAFCQGQPSLLPELPLQYADFTIWERKRLQGEVLQNLLDYWKQRLGDSLPILELPSDRPRPAISSHPKGAAQIFQISPELTQKLVAFSQQEKVTLFMTLLAAFKILLYRYTHQEDIIVGTPIANRNRSETEGLIGFFVNTLVLRTNLANNPSFRELLQQVREVTLGAYAHQDLPFEKLVEELQPGRNLSHNPLFQVMFVLQNASTEVLRLPELTIEPLKIQKKTTNFDLTLSISETQTSLKGDLEYNTDIFNDDRITRMLGHFQVLLEAIVTNPQQRLSELPLLTPNEEQQLLVEWNKTQVEYPQKQCIHQLFAAQVQKTPEAVAVVCKNEYLTYKQLNAKANQLARYLQKQGVKPEEFVGICVERSLEMAIGLLGILKAGGAYIPLDPSYPQQRLAWMQENSQLKILLTQKHLLASLPACKAKVICLDTNWELIAAEAVDNPVCSISSENLAYVIYTSGSTGQPKGAMNTHQAVCNRLLWMQDYCQLTPADKVLQKTPFSFDVSVWEIFLPLMVGASLVLAEPNGHRDPNYLVKLIVQQQITTVHFVPSMLQVFLQHPDVETCKSLRRVICSGEALTLELQKRYFSRLNAPLFNFYGPTEAAIDVTFCKCENHPFSTAAPPIGRPIANTQIYLLDRYLNPVPIGVPGELYIGGIGVGRGYLNNPQLTAQKFIPDPFSKIPGVRLYKTGDLARYLPDGNIEYLGRIDYQVKLRGFRIELGEIEAVLEQHPAVSQCVVMMREDIPGNQCLVAYVAAENVASDELRQHLRHKLPEHMIPGAFVILDSLPLTFNGKVNRLALPAPTRQQLEENNYLTLTPIQEILAGIWSEILAIKPIGIHDNFFELGGHSLVATRVISQIRKVFQIELPLRCVFESPTIAKLAAEIEKFTKADCSVKLPRIQVISRTDKIPLSYAQQRLWYFYQLEPNNTAYNMCNAVRIIGSLNVPALEQSLNEIIRRHEILRTNFVLERGQPIQVIAPSLNLELPVIDLRQLSKAVREQTVQNLVNQETEKPFRLDTDPLLRVTLLHLEENEYVLLFTMHHIISDGWSMGVLIQELASLYQANSLCKPSSLPQLPIQYADFAIWQRQWLQGEFLDKLLAYWKQQLQNLPTLKLPTDYPRPPIPTYRGSAQPFTISPTLSQQIKILSNQQGVTFFMILQAAFAILMHYYSKQDDIAIGTDVANRNQGETEGLIGFFVNQLVLRINLEGNPSFQELLERVRAVNLTAYTYQDLPFDKLVEAINPERNLQTTPLFQVKLIFQNTPTTALNIPGLNFQTLETETKTATFDLLFEIRETEHNFVGLLKYSNDLFAAKTISKMLKYFEKILNHVVLYPTIKINQIQEILMQLEKQDRLTQEKKYENSLQQKLSQIRRKSV